MVEAEVEVDAHAEPGDGVAEVLHGEEDEAVIDEDRRSGDGQDVAEEPQRPGQEEQDDGQDGRQEDREEEHFGRHRSHQLICVVAMFVSFIG